MVRKTLLGTLAFLLVATIVVQAIYIDYLKRQYRVDVRGFAHLHTLEVLQKTREFADLNPVTRDGYRALIIALAMEQSQLQQWQAKSGYELTYAHRALLSRVDDYQSPKAPPQGAELLAK
ncbi:MAG: hypothetical protein QM805_07370 [Pseudomonas sp.]